MPSDALRVTTAHLRELASKHGHAATEMNIAAEHVAGVHQRIRISHGTVASPTAAMIETIEQNRRAAAQRIAEASGALGEGLTTAAYQYETTDHASATRVDGIPW